MVTATPCRGRLDGRTVLITGGASGIGHATAQRCATEGATVVLTDVDEDAGRAAADKLSDEQGSVSFRKLDVRDGDAVERTIRAVADEHDGLEVLVNNAGVAQLGVLEDTTRDERDLIIDVNINGVWNGCRAALPLMKDAGHGSIVNVSSAGGLQGTPKLATYALTKAAIVNFTRALAGEAGSYSVRVNAVCPGTIETPLATSVMADQENPAAARKRAEEAHPLGRLGDPTEVAASIAFLASSDASFITGLAMTVDGGSSAVLRQR